MKTIFKFIDEKFNILMLILVNFVVFLYIALAFAAPIAEFLGYDSFANLIYFIYSFFCHQRPERSFFIFGYKMAFCARDLFIFTAFLIIGVLSFFPKIKLKRLSIPGLFFFTIPILLDGGIQLVSEVLKIFRHSGGFYESTNFMRFLTGTLFGIGLGLFFIPILKNENEDNSNNTLIVVITFFLSFLIYMCLANFEKIIFIQFWSTI